MNGQMMMAIPNIQQTKNQDNYSGLKLRLL